MLKKTDLKRTLQTFPEKAQLMYHKEDTFYKSWKITNLSETEDRGRVIQSADDKNFLLHALVIYICIKLTETKLFYLVIYLPILLCTKSFPLLFFLFFVTVIDFTVPVCHESCISQTTVCLWAILGQNHVLHQKLEERLACASISPHLYLLSHILQVQRYRQLQQLHYDFRDFRSWNLSCHYCSWQESWHGTLSFPQQTFCISPPPPSYWLETVRCQ